MAYISRQRKGGGGGGGVLRQQTFWCPTRQSNPATVEVVPGVKSTGTALVINYGFLAKLTGPVARANSRDPKSVSRFTPLKSASLPKSVPAMMAALLEIVWLCALIPLAILAARASTRQWLFADAILTFFFAACTIPFAVESQQMQVGLLTTS